MTTLSNKDLKLQVETQAREHLQTMQDAFDKIRPTCGVCWDDAEHERGFCKTAEGKSYEDYYQSTRTTDHSIDGPSDKQVSFIKSLFVEREVGKPGVSFEQWANAIKLERFTVSEASRLIDELLKRDRKALETTTPVAPNPDGLDLRQLKSGYFAVPGGDTRLKLKIDVVDKGKWAGWVFVKDAAVYGEGQRYGSQRPGESYKGKVEDVLTLIADDPKAAMAEYGKLTSRCGRCNRPLEDETSVKLGIGPICREM